MRHGRLLRCWNWRRASRNSLPPRSQRVNQTKPRCKNRMVFSPARPWNTPLIESNRRHSSGSRINLASSRMEAITENASWKSTVLTVHPATPLPSLQKGHAFSEGAHRWSKKRSFFNWLSSTKSMRETYKDLTLIIIMGTESSLTTC
jgi:hypothetical protein